MLSETKTSEFIYQGGNNPSWNSWIESTYQYCDIPYVFSDFFSYSLTPFFF